MPTHKPPKYNEKAIFLKIINGKRKKKGTWSTLLRTGCVYSLIHRPVVYKIILLYIPTAQ